MSGKTIHFLLVFDHSAGRLVAETPFEDPAEATAAYSAAEREHGDDDALEIVLVGADSIETIHETHASYFEGATMLKKYLGRYLTSTV